MRIELQADFLAGVWAYHDNEMFSSIEDGDLEEALDASMKIGDDYLQKPRPRLLPCLTLLTHGTSAQRSRWSKGLSTGDPQPGRHILHPLFQPVISGRSQTSISEIARQMHDIFTPSTYHAYINSIFPAPETQKSLRVLSHRYGP